MFLKQLVEFADRQLELPPTSYIRKPIEWIIDLENWGGFKGFVPTGDISDRSSLLHFNVPDLVRSVAIKPKLLADNGEYVLGITREGGKAEKVFERHNAFIDTVQICKNEVANDDLYAVYRFLKHLDLKDFDVPDDFDPSHNIIFRVEGRLPTDDPEVQRWWASKQEDYDVSRMECIVSGELCRPEKRLQVKIKGIPGGQTAGNALISANSPAFESYGLEASLIAPISKASVERFSHALNHLLREKRHHVRIGPIAYIFWTRKETNLNPASFLMDPDPEEVRNLILSVYSGKNEGALEDENAFYGAALSASGSRVVVKDWIDTTVSKVKENLARWFLLQEIVQGNGESGEPLKLTSLAGATVRDFKDLPAHIPRSLIFSALNGGPLPDDLLFQAIKRNRAKQRVTRPRAALIKMVLLSKETTHSEVTMSELDHANQEPAYQCGRLLAVLESIQRLALPGISATIVDRYFGTASSAPASVFGTLMRGAQAHLSKLRKSKPGLFVNLQKQLEEVTRHLDHFPPTLDMKKQALFSLGYYHQRAWREAKDENKKEASA